MTNNSDNSSDAETLRRYFGSVPLLLGPPEAKEKTSLKMEGDGHLKEVFEGSFARMILE